MSDPTAKITARRVDTDVAVIGAGPAGLALFGVLNYPVAHEKGRPRSASVDKSTMGQSLTNR